MTLPFVGNEPFAVTTETLLAAALQAHELGLAVAQYAGDVAYQSMHGH